MELNKKNNNDCLDINLKCHTCGEFINAYSENYSVGDMQLQSVDIYMPAIDGDEGFSKIFYEVEEIKLQDNNYKGEFDSIFYCGHCNNQIKTSYKKRNKRKYKKFWGINPLDIKVN